MACYWFEWMIVFNDYCKKKKQKLSFVPRSFCVVTQGKSDFIWCIWQSLLSTSEKLGKGINTLMTSLCELFQLKYTHGVIKRRKFVVYSAIYLCIENVDFSIPLRPNDVDSEYISINTNKIYNQLKQSEIIANVTKDSKEDKILEMNKYLYNF